MGVVFLVKISLSRNGKANKDELHFVSLGR